MAGGVHVDDRRGRLHPALGRAALAGRPDLQLRILNPPYKKLNTGSAWRMALRSLGIEAVNLYAAFVAVAGGEVVAITPRSFCNGPYYQPFRRQMLTESALLFVHMFGSRKTAFKEMTSSRRTSSPTWARAASRTRSASPPTNAPARTVPFAEVVRLGDRHMFIRLAISIGDTNLATRVQMLPCTLADLGITVSTGRVVDFRAREHLRKGAGE